MNNRIKLLPNGDFEVVGRAQVSAKMPKTYVVSLVSVTNMAKNMGPRGVSILMNFFGMSEEDAEGIMSGKAKYEIVANRLTVF